MVNSADLNITTNDRKSSLLYFVMGFDCIFIGLLFQLTVVVNFLHFNSLKFIHCAVGCAYFIVRNFPIRLIRITGPIYLFLS